MYARKFQNIAFGYAIPSYSHNIESTLHICVHVYYITKERSLESLHIIHIFPTFGPKFGLLELR